QFVGLEFGQSGKFEVSDLRAPVQSAVVGQVDGQVFFVPLRLGLNRCQKKSICVEQVEQRSFSIRDQIPDKWRLFRNVHRLQHARIGKRVRAGERNQAHIKGGLH